MTQDRVRRSPLKKSQAKRCPCLVHTSEAKGGGPGMQAAGDLAVERQPLPLAGDADRLLVQACLAGDAAAFETLMERHWRKVASVAGRFLDDPNDVDDALQETFVQA